VPLINNHLFFAKLTVLAGVLISVFFSTAATAQLTGISVSIEDYSSTWQFGTLERTVDINQWSLNLEEKTTSALRVGVSLGQLGMRVSDQVLPANTEKFDANSVGLYLRLPLMLGDTFSLQGRLSYRIYSGSDSNDIDSREIEWDETRVELGFSGQWQSVRLTPFVAYRTINGDITDNSGIELFDSIDEVSSGIRFDYFIEPTAYIRFQFTRGAREGGYLVFAREY